MNNAIYKKAIEAKNALLDSKTLREVYAIPYPFTVGQLGRNSSTEFSLLKDTKRVVLNAEGNPDKSQYHMNTFVVSDPNRAEPQPHTDFQDRVRKKRMFLAATNNGTFALAHSDTTSAFNDAGLGNLLDIELGDHLEKIKDSLLVERFNGRYTQNLFQLRRSLQITGLFSMFAGSDKNLKLRALRNIVLEGAKQLEPREIAVMSQDFTLHYSPQDVTLGRQLVKNVIGNG